MAFSLKRVVPTGTHLSLGCLLPHEGFLDCWKSLQQKVFNHNHVLIEIGSVRCQPAFDSILLSLCLCAYCSSLGLAGLRSPMPYILLFCSQPSTELPFNASYCSPAERFLSMLPYCCPRARCYSPWLPDKREKSLPQAA